jgi:hypothetical protein
MANKKNGAGITKQDAVRRALAALGKQASAKDIQKHVMETFGFDMSIDHVYNAKSNVLSKAKKAKAKMSPAPQVAVAVLSVQPAPAPVATKKPGGISLEDVQTTKALLGRVGAEQLLSLIALLAT